MNMLLIICCFFSPWLITQTVTAIDTINSNQSIRDGGDTIVSAGGKFELGFFSPGSSRNRYLGIWYCNITPRTVVWVANRNTALTDASGLLRLTAEGTLVLLNRSDSVIWSSNSSRSARNPVAQLLDSSNLVVRDGGDTNLENSLWQSFDYIGDTLMPGMKHGRDLKTGLDRYLTSWKSPDDPSDGDYTFRLDKRGYAELIMKQGSTDLFRTGPWNGVWLSGKAPVNSIPMLSYGFVSNDEEVCYTSGYINDSILTRFVLNHQDGKIQQFNWFDPNRGWVQFLTLQTDSCDDYNRCHAYASCDINRTPPCDCLKGFVPKAPKDWEATDWSGGCVRKTTPNCSTDDFLKRTGLKTPDTRTSWFNESMSLEECKSMCKRNCSCTAYANMDIRNGGSGCFLWFDELIDIKVIDNQQDIYIRVAPSDIDAAEGKTRNARKRLKIVLSTVLSTAMFFVILTFLWYYRKKKLQKDGRMESNLELPLFDLDTLSRATNDFSDSNKIGQGGYGPVYKGTLKDGQEIAVKRLSKTSTQGHDEFKNEVIHIVKLQHRNLVKLLGCCIQGDEKMLIYEFMPNKSLDLFILDSLRSKQLDWPKRYHIINGIARGLLYLHQDSRLRIIHRDLKASNILLDQEMNPKISDFGLARSSSGENDAEINTNKVAGTYGYISPEYAVDGLYSAKSDVFSFGVIVLEIVSGRRNRGYHHPDHQLNLLGHAWRLYKEERCSELIAATLLESCNSSEILRSIHVGLLCVQSSPKDRPSMSSIVFMLASEGELPEPKQPGFFIERELEDASSSSSNKRPYSANELSMTLLEAR